MDSLDQKIAAKERECIDLQQRLEKARLELRVFKEAAALRPGNNLAVLSASAHRGDEPAPAKEVFSSYQKVFDGILPATNSNGHTRRRGGGKGRMPGTITVPWQRTLGAMVKLGNVPQPPLAIVKIAAGTGLEVSPHEVRERMRAYVKTGLIERVDMEYKVSASAIERFSLMK